VDSGVPSRAEILVIVAGPEEVAATDLEDHWAVRLASDPAPRSWTARVAMYSVPGPTVALHQVQIVQPVALKPMEHVKGWDVLTLMEGVSVVHVCRPYTRAGEVAVLAARLLGKRLSVSELSVRTSEVGRSLGLIHLADMVLYDSDEDAAEAAGHPLTARVDSMTDDWPTLVLDNRAVTSRGVETDL